MAKGALPGAMHSVHLDGMALRKSMVPNAVETWGTDKRVSSAKCLSPEGLFSVQE
jgi:hypothetical protein